MNEKKCPKCGHAISYKFGGRKVKCPECKWKVDLPRTDSDVLRSIDAQLDAIRSNTNILWFMVGIMTLLMVVGTFISVMVGLMS